ncbi:esterase/lipase family protein [Corynebacterium lowii]|nr:alpha/beta fold hydrolase [Corynebacterium lowii]MDP9851797.1 triacylglycerol esterase/lipase EstA (alpha/beta hydrolase family) [Corynebacterium lowii]
MWSLLVGLDHFFYSRILPVLAGIFLFWKDVRYLMKALRLSLACAAAIATFAGGAQALAEPGSSESAFGAGGDVLEWTGMGPQGERADGFVDVMAKQGLTEDISPLGSNVACVPQPGENPVILLHGLNSNSYQTFAAMAPDLAGMGKCVYAFNVGKISGTLEPDGSSVLGSIPMFRAMAPINDSLAEISEKIAQVKAMTGAQKVDLVGHSAGATIATAYTKQVHGEGVGTVVSIAGVLHGTGLLGVSYGLEKLNGLNGMGNLVTALIASPSVRDLLPNSDFNKALHDGPIEVPGVKYVSIASKFDEAVTPLSAAQYTDPGAENYVLQEGCSLDASEHLGITYSPRAIAMTARALGRDVEVPCSPMTASSENSSPEVGSSNIATLPGVVDGFSPVDEMSARLSS